MLLLRAERRVESPIFLGRVETRRRSADNKIELLCHPHFDYAALRSARYFYENCPLPLHWQLMPFTDG